MSNVLAPCVFAWHRLNACHFVCSQCQNGQWPDNGITFIHSLGRSFSPLLRFEFMAFRSVNLDIIGFFFSYGNCRAIFLSLFRFTGLVRVPRLLLLLHTVEFIGCWLAKKKKKLCVRNCSHLIGIHVVRK